MMLLKVHLKMYSGAEPLYWVMRSWQKKEKMMWCISGARESQVAIVVGVIDGGIGYESS